MTISCLLLSRKSKRYRSNCHMISWLLNENKVNLMVKTDFIIFNMLFVFSDIPNVFLQHSNFYFSPRVFETVLPISENCNLGEKQCFWLPWNLLPLLILIISGVLQSFFIFFCVHWTCAALFFFADGDWKVWVSTAETATNADVGLVVYGDKSNSGMIIIGSSGSKTLFQADNTDEFKVRCFKRFSFSFMC